MRILGIDYGSKRVGIAISDEDAQFALPVSVLKNTAGLIAEVQKIAQANEVKEIVLGESRNYKGEANTILEASQKFKEELEKLGFVVTFEPEFMTSVNAERFQGKNDKSDSSAAALILQSYLDRLNVQK
jgi:putative Holliday junction resolvase